MMRSIRITVASLLAVVLAACASAGSGSGAAVRHNLVTAQELAPMQNLQLYDALTRIRPTWFRSRNVLTQSNPNPTPVHVYVNGMRSEGIDALSQISVQSVAEVRFYEPQDANTRFGTGNNGGAIEVKLKP